jgi:hypothetical protein
VRGLRHRRADAAPLALACGAAGFYNGRGGFGFPEGRGGE